MRKKKLWPDALNFPSMEAHIRMPKRVFNREEIDRIMGLYGSGAYIESIAKNVGNASIKEVNEVIDTYQSVYFDC